MPNKINNNEVIKKYIGSTNPSSVIIKNPTKTFTFYHLFILAIIPTS